MYHISAHFSYTDFNQDPVTLIEVIINHWRENGQIIGREFPISYQAEETPYFAVSLNVPALDSLAPQNNNTLVSEALTFAQQQGVTLQGYEVIGRDYSADETDEEKNRPDFLILYTTHLNSCSPLYNGNNFYPIPLYRLLREHTELCQRIIKWQENWQACDQLQMNGGILEQESLAQISDVDSVLAIEGRAICQEIEQITGLPTYYYLYRLGTDREAEYQRKCPITGKEWRLSEPLHEIFHFKSDEARLLSNISWEILA